MRVSVVVVALLAMSLWQLTGSAFGADKKWKADAGRGQRLAVRLCANCHLVGTHPARSAVVGVPSFSAIANLPGRTAKHITNTLVQPHQPMPDAQLTMHEIRDLLAYIETLRKTPKSRSNDDDIRPKPKYPSAS